nr:hypothetical protein [Crucivirus sp.]
MAFRRRKFRKSFGRRRTYGRRSFGFGKRRKIAKLYVTNPVTGREILLKSLVAEARKNPSKYRSLRTKKKKVKQVTLDANTGQKVIVGEIARIGKKRKLGPLADIDPYVAPQVLPPLPNGDMPVD